MINLANPSVRVPSAITRFHAAITHFSFGRTNPPSPQLLTEISYDDAMAELGFARTNGLCFVQSTSWLCMGIGGGFFWAARHVDVPYAAKILGAAALGAGLLFGFAGALDKLTSFSISPETIPDNPDSDLVSVETVSDIPDTPLLSVETASENSTNTVV